MTGIMIPKRVYLEIYSINRDFSQELLIDFKNCTSIAINVNGHFEIGPKVLDYEVFS